MFYFSNKDNPVLTENIFYIIRNARRYIKTGNFFFKDPKIHEELLDAAKRGVAIFVLSNLTGNENRGYRNTKIKAEADPHIVNLHEMEQRGIHVRLCRDLHAKFLIADGEKGLIMSANYTPDSLYENPENGVDIIGSELTQLEDIFDELYLHPDTILLGDGRQYRYAEKNEPICAGAFDHIDKSSRLLMTMASKESSNLRECQYLSIYERIIELINNAQDFIQIVSWSYTDIENLPEFVNSLISASKRGVKIKLYFGTKGEEGRLKRTQKQLESLNKQLKYQASVLPLEDSHAKCVITDNSAMMFTSNIDGKRGLLSGFELGFVLTEKERQQAMIQLKEIENNGK